MLLYYIMFGTHLGRLQKQVSGNSLLRNLRLSLFPTQKTTPTLKTPAKNYEKEYNQYQQSNRLSYEDFLRINWRR